MFTVSKEFHFEAAHHLPLHDGKCRQPHGHSYRVVVHCRGEPRASGTKTGMVIDYADIAAAAQPIVDRLDHRDLNEVLAGVTTTAEGLARYFFDELGAPLGALLHAVDVYETPTSRVRYQRGA